MSEIASQPCGPELASRACGPEFSPPAALRNAHVQTFSASWPRRVAELPAGEPARFVAPDGEPLCARVHWQPGPRDRSPAALLIHGLEGSATSSYVRATAARLLRAGWHVVRLDQRGCGEGERATPTLHHGGRSDDLAAVVGALLEREGVARLAAIGFSLGGAVLLKLLGEYGSAPPRGLVAAAALSPLLNPLHVQRHLDRPTSVLYRRFFLGRMAAKLRRRAALFPGDHPAHDYRARTVLEFDERFTAPRIGYASAEEYYRRADALPLLPAIRVPTLLLHAQDDPVVPFAGLAAGLPTRGAVRVELPRHGGHLGFYDPGVAGDGRWAEQRAADFLQATLA